MQELINKNRQVIGAIVIAALALIYYFFFYAPGASSPTLTSTSAGDGSPASQELLITLSNLHTIKLDETFFQDPVFVSLSDYGVTIPAQPVGRRNPFEALFITSAQAQASASSTTIKAPSIKK